MIMGMEIFTRFQKEKAVRASGLSEGPAGCSGMKKAGAESRRLIGRLRRAGAGLLGAAALLLSGGCESDAPSGPLVVYSAGPRHLAEEICATFTERTGIRTRLYTATTGEIMARLETERSRPRADVVVLAGQTAAEILKREGMLIPLPTGRWSGLRPEWSDPEGYYAGTGACILGVALAGDGLGDGANWQDYFNADGAIMPSPSQSGSSAEFVVAMNLAEGEAFWDSVQAARARGLEIAGPNSKALRSLEIGAHELILAAADYLVFEQMARGQPLRVVYPRPASPLSLRPICILASSPRPEAAARFVEFYFSKEAQGLVAAKHLLPADPGIEVSEQRRSATPPSALILTGPTEAFLRQRDSLARFRIEVELGTPP